MERMKRSERFKDTYSEPEVEVSKSEAEAPDHGMMFGDTKLSFSKLKPVTEVNRERRDDETPEEHAFRLMSYDENAFIAGLLATERGEENGMADALKTGNYRIKRMQCREFLDAIASMSEEEYAQKINAAWGAFTTDQMRTTAARIADSLRDRALAQAEAGSTIERKTVRSHEMTVNDSTDVRGASLEASRGWEPDFSRGRMPDISASQGEMVRSVFMNKYCREKQERRSHNFFAKVKGLFGKTDKQKKTKTAPARKIRKLESIEQAERPENGWFNGQVSEYGMAPPEGGYFGNRGSEEAPEPEKRYFDKPRRQYHDEYDFVDLGKYDSLGIDEPDNFSMDDWYSRRSA